MPEKLIWLVWNPEWLGKLLPLDNFARTGGVTESVAHTLELSGLDLDVKAVRCNGIDECIKAMKMASFGKLDANFIEGMACKHGCTGGAASLLHDAKGIEMINRYGKESKTDNPLIFWKNSRLIHHGNVSATKIKIRKPHGYDHKGFFY